MLAQKQNLLKTLFSVECVIFSAQQMCFACEQRDIIDSLRYDFTYTTFFLTRATFSEQNALTKKIIGISQIKNSRTLLVKKPLFPKRLNNQITLFAWLPHFTKNIDVEDKWIRVNVGICVITNLIHRNNASSSSWPRMPRLRPRIPSTSNSKPLEDRKTDEFLDSVSKKEASDMMRQRNLAQDFIRDVSSELIDEYDIQVIDGKQELTTDMTIEVEIAHLFLISIEGNNTIQNK
ncbi:hypothetical protein GLOIN_2v1870293 [Rhizophagus clarus]|uniref:Uncharacterized protein n=1 Tax=Rhizophagus clarus TaxID=94130 RepID=A0A8H3KXR9_9GLOM|nr:hypothetical protein GLOIN_2v1870293 [Rhizophagus clarus]